MRVRLMIIPAAILMLLFNALSAAQMQDAQVTVPDLTALSPPQAAAQLHQIGLKLGVENYVSWSDASGLPPNTIQTQTPAPGDTVSRGAAVDITVARSANAILIYDTNDFTLVNRTNAPVDLPSLTFRAVDASAAFEAERWGDTLEGNDCVQVWSVPRSSGKSLVECEAVQRWLATTIPGAHFWTTNSGVTEFEVVQNGNVTATCPAAADETTPTRCELFLSPQTPITDATNYVYFVYTVDRLAIVNQALNAWMQLDNMVVYSDHPNLVPRTQIITLSNADLYEHTADDVTRLAANQCVLFIGGAAVETAPPEPCEVIAQSTIDSSISFWSSAFAVSSPSRFDRTTCPAAVPDQVTLCIVPR